MKGTTILVATALVLITMLTGQLPAAGDTATPAPQQEAASQASAQPTAKPAVDESYIVKPEDVLGLDVWGEPEMSKQQMPVTPEGKINVPFLGTIQAAGLTQQQLADNIGKGFVDAEILKNPRVVVSLLSLHKRTVRVLGQVNRPGEYEFREGDTVMEAVANAGSFTENSYLEGTTLTRRDGGIVNLNLRQLFYKGDMTQNLRLEHGDTINIPEDFVNKYYVLGEINRPGQYQLREGVTALSAVSLAGGPTPRGTLRSVAIVRNASKGTQRLNVNISKLIDTGDTKQDIPLKPGDVVYVSKTSTPDWNKIFQAISAVGNAAYMIRRY